MRIADAKDFVRLHPNDDKDYWTDELCFVKIPIPGSKNEALHLIDEDLAMQYLESTQIERKRLVLATKPFDKFFPCEVPTRNLDNQWNESNLKGCLEAVDFWTMVVSRSKEGVEGYKSTFARNQDAFPDPKWLTQSMEELIGRTFDNRVIESADHPGLLCLIGAKVS